VATSSRTATRRRANAASELSAPKGALGRTAVNKAPSANGEDKISSTDQIVAGILRGLYEGQYVAGQKLTEADLTRRFSVGRGTVREALQRLAAEGLVTVSLHKGASIRALTREGVRDVLDVIEALAGLAARRAAERLERSEDERALRATMSALTALAAAGDTFEFARMRDRMYRQLAEISGNREITRLLSMVQVHLIRVQFRSAYGLHREERLKDYKRIIEAILARDGAGAERAMRQHIRSTARAIEELPDRNFDL
jgi:DNA-binding GntR family transcriptional regulator